MANEIYIEDKSEGATFGPYIPNGEVVVHRRIGKQSELEVNLSRTVNQDLSITEDEDWLRFDKDGATEFQGVIRSTKKPTSSQLNVFVDSFERLAKEAEPSPQNFEFNDVADTSPVEQAINDVSQLSVGTVENVKSGLTFSFDFVSPARRLRIVRSTTNAHIRYNADQTVDYVASIGSDRTATQISPQSDNVEKFEPRLAGGNKTYNKAVVLGGGGGDAKTVVEVTADNYSSGERERWITLSNRDLNDSDTLREYGEEVINQLSIQHIDVNTKIRGLNVSIGDVFTVLYDKKDINRELEAKEVSTHYSPLGVYQNVRFKTADIGRIDRFDEISEDIERFNRSEGDRVVGTFDNPTQAPPQEGNIIYVTGNNADYPRGIYYQNGDAYEQTLRGDVDTNNVFADTSFVAPTGSVSNDGAVLPVGTNRYETT